MPRCWYIVASGGGVGDFGVRSGEVYHAGEPEGIADDELAGDRFLHLQLGGEENDRPPGIHHSFKMFTSSMLAYWTEKNAVP